MATGSQHDPATKENCSRFRLVAISSIFVISVVFLGFHKISWIFQWSGVQGLAPDCHQIKTRSCYKETFARSQPVAISTVFHGFRTCLLGISEDFMNFMDFMCQMVFAWIAWLLAGGAGQAEGGWVPRMAG